MCFGGGDTPQQPVNPAPYPYAEMTTKSVEPEAKPIAPEDPAKASQPKAPTTATDTGANFDNLRM